MISGRLPVVGLSALTGRGIERLLPTVQQAYSSWNKRVNTGKINRMLSELRGNRPQSSKQDVITRIKYMTQVKARPPSFVAFLSGSSPVPENGIKNLAQSIRKHLGFEGVPVRLWMRPAEARTLMAKTRIARKGRPMALRGGISSQQRRKKIVDFMMDKARLQSAADGNGERKESKIRFNIRVRQLLGNNR